MKFVENIDIETCRKLIEKINSKYNIQAFIEMIRCDFSIFAYNYNINGMFIGDTDEETMLLREFRGLTFNNKTNKLLCRKYHKFFNYGENEISRNFNFSESHIFLDKLDGSMVVAFMDNDVIHFHTKRGFSDTAKNATAFALKNFKFVEFSKRMTQNGYNPIFEYVDPSIPIVIRYPKEDMILTAIRELSTGNYVSYGKLCELAELWDINVVKKFDIKDIRETEYSLENDRDFEGYVIHFESGEMVKLKASHYLQIHKSKEGVQNEKDLIQLIVNQKLDDIYPHLDGFTREKIQSFEKDFWINVNIFKTDLKSIRERVLSETNTKKEYVFKILESIEKVKHSYLLSSYENDSLIDSIVEKNLKGILTSTQADDKRFIYRINWRDYQ